MPREMSRNPPHVDWLRRAKSNLARARQNKPDEVVYEDLCFDAQQAVEKALKALLLFKGASFRYVHDIGELLGAVAIARIAIPEELLFASELTEYAVETRYPGPFEEVTESEWRTALQQAEAIVSWVEGLMQSEG